MDENGTLERRGRSPSNRHDRSSSRQKRHRSNDRGRSDSRDWRSRSRSSHRRRRSRSRSRSRTQKNKKSKWDMPATEDNSGFGGTPYGGMMLPSLQAPVEDRRARRLYIGNLPGGVSEQAIVQFFNGALLAAFGVDYSVASASGQFPVLKAEIGPRRPDAAGQADHRYCFLEFRTIADANICLKLDGISFNGFTLKVGRPNDYAAIPPTTEMSTAEALAAATKGVPKLAQLVVETKMYVQGLPSSVTDEHLRKMAERFGTVKSAALMKDLRTGQSMGCGIVEFEVVRDLDTAVEVLNQEPIDGQTVRFSKGPLIPAGGKISTDTTPIVGMQTSSVVTELPTSMTYKVLSNAIVGAQVKAARQQGGIPSKVVQLLNTVFPEDLIKDDEYDSVVKDMKEEASQFGTLLDVAVPRPATDLSFKEGVGKVFLHFSDITAARRAQAELNGRRYEERRVVCAAFYPEDRFLKGKYTLV